MNDLKSSGGKWQRMIGAARAEADRVRGDSSGPGGGERPEGTASGTEWPAAASFAGYELLGEVHRGGQAVVYRAVQKSTRQKVAIKVLREGAFAGPQDRTRFQREVQILGQLRHPNIVSIHDSGATSGHFYLVMDYISGEALDAHMARRPRTIRETLELFAEICDAVHAAHLRGVIHRDLKPSNIRIDAAGRPHLLDFGLAKVALGATGDEAGPDAMTRTGAFVGSLPWASPEQAGGAAGEVDLRTDVYALGVILFQMLTGRLPYAVGGPIREALETICSAAPTRPSAGRGEIDDELDTIVLKCLAKERDRRYQSAGEIARDVRRYLRGEPIEAKRDSSWYVLKKTLLRHKAPTALAATFLVVGFSAGALITARYYRALRDVRAAETTAREAIAAEQQARAEAERAKRNLRLVEDVADVPAEERLAGGDPDRRYFLIGPKPGAAEPASGWRLLVVLPGGDGSADFTPFVRRILKYALPDGYLIAQPIAKEWTPDQFDSLVWPTRTNPWPGMRFSTEELVESVIADVHRARRIDPRYIFALGWSSGGPACYALSLTGRTSVTGSFPVMSVFGWEDPALLERAAGQAYVIMHSPDDELVPLSHPQRACDVLREQGARVETIEYAGGHGWHGGCYEQIREGILWLEGNHAVPGGVE